MTPHYFISLWALIDLASYIFCLRLRGTVRSQKGGRIFRSYTGKLLNYLTSHFPSYIQERITLRAFIARCHLSHFSHLPLCEASFLLSINIINRLRYSFNTGEIRINEEELNLAVRH